jgi:hypothetical protein
MFTKLRWTIYTLIVLAGLIVVLVGEAWKWMVG